MIQQQPLEVRPHHRPGLAGEIELAELADARVDVGLRDGVEDGVGAGRERPQLAQHLAAEERPDAIGGVGQHRLAHDVVDHHRAAGEDPVGADEARGALPQPRQGVQQQLERRIAVVAAPAAVVDDARPVGQPGRRRGRRQRHLVDDERLQAHRREAGLGHRRHRRQLAGQHVPHRPLVGSLRSFSKVTTPTFGRKQNTRP